MPVRTSLTGVNTDIADCMNNACGASTVPYQVMRIDFLRWISLIIRCSLDVEVGAAPVYDTGPFVLNCTMLRRKEEAVHFVYTRRQEQVRFGTRWIFTAIVDCIDFFFLVTCMQIENDTPETDTCPVLAIQL